MRGRFLNPLGIIRRLEPEGRYVVTENKCPILEANPKRSYLQKNSAREGEISVCRIIILRKGSELVQNNRSKKS